MYSGCTRVRRNGARQVRVRYSGAERRAMPLPRWHFPHVRSAVGGGRCWIDPCCFRVLKAKENGRGVEGTVPAAAAVETSCTPRPPRHPPRSPERAKRSWPFRRPNDQFLIPDFLCSRASGISPAPNCGPICPRVLVFTDAGVFRATHHRPALAGLQAPVSYLIRQSAVES